MATRGISTAKPDVMAGSEKRPLGPARWLLAGFIFFGVLEVLARIVAATNLPIAYGIRYWQSLTFCMRRDAETDSLLLRANATFTQLNSEGDLVLVAADSSGFRNDINFERQRIVALGDSFTFGDQVDIRARWSSLLGGRMREDVYNAGAALSGPAQQRILLQRLLRQKPQQPRLILWMIYSGNDISDTLAFNSRTGVETREERNESDHAFFRFALKNSYALRLGYVVTRFVNRGISQRGAQGRRFHVNGGDFQFFPVDEQFLASESFRAGLRGIQDAILSLSAETRRIGATLVVLYAPSKEEAFEGLLRRDHQIAPGSILRFDEPLGEFCSANQIPFLNLREDFRQATEQGAALYFQRDGHWNKEGHSLASDKIFDFLEQNGFIPKAAAP